MQHSLKRENNNIPTADIARSCSTSLSYTSVEREIFKASSETSLVRKDDHFDDQGNRKEKHV